MNIPEGFKLVPVELTDEMRDVIRGGGYSGHLYSNLLAAAPTPPKPIYDEAKERELFEAWALSENVDSSANKWDGILSWAAWLACAQSRAKAGEVGHE